RVSASGRNASASDHVDANGNFTLTGIPDGTITVIAFKQGMPMRQSAPKVIQVVNGSAPPVDIDFGAGITIRGRVTRVVDAVTGVPLPDVRVFITPAAAQGGRIWRNAMTDSDGRFTLDTLPDGSYTLRTEREHYAVASQTITVSGGSTPPIEVRLARGQ